MTRMRDRMPSVHDVEQIARREAQREAEKILTGSHIVPMPTSTPPAMRVAQKAWWKATVFLLTHAFAAAAGAAGSAAFQHCAANATAPTPAIAR